MAHPPSRQPDPSYMTRHYGALLTIVSVLLWATALRLLSSFLEGSAIVCAAAPAAVGVLFAAALALRGRLLGEGDEHKRFVARAAISLLAALAMLYVDAYGMNGGLLHGITDLFGLAAFAERHQLALSTAAALGIVHPILFAIAAAPRVFSRS